MGMGSIYIPVAARFEENTESVDALSVREPMVMREYTRGQQRESSPVGWTDGGVRNLFQLLGKKVVKGREGS